jgi:hypothetical protein
MKNKNIKRSIVLVPAILTVLIVLSSFILTHKGTKERTTNGVRFSTGSLLLTKANNKPILLYSILKSVDAGGNWKDVSKTPPKIKQTASERFKASSDGVLIATSKNGIIRSTDNGEHWKTVIREEGGGTAVSIIKGGFTAITFDKATKSNKVHISLDRGKTWQSIDKGLPTSISSIQQMGLYLICGHMGGLFRSADMGKTWKTVYCAIPVHNEFEFIQASIFPRNQREFVLRLYVSGNALYAISEPAGC